MMDTQMTVPTPQEPAVKPNIHSKMKHHKELSQKLFQKMSASDFITMQMLKHYADESPDGRVYLDDMSKQMNRSIRSISHLAKDLQRKGLVQWEFDSEHKSGTYLRLTDTTIESSSEQELLLKNVFENVIHIYGQEEFAEFVKQFIRLEMVLEQEIEKIDSNE